MPIEGRQKTLVIATLAVVSVFVADRLILSPLTALWNRRSEAIAELHKQVNSGTAVIGREAALRRTWDRMRTNALPDTPSLAEQQMLKAIENWSSQSRTAIVSLTPQWKQDADDHNVLECRVEAAGYLAGLAQFLFELENSNMALRPSGLELSSRDNEGREMTLTVLISGLTLGNAPKQ